MWVCFLTGLILCFSFVSLSDSPHLTVMYTRLVPTRELGIPPSTGHQLLLEGAVPAHWLLSPLTFSSLYVFLQNFKDYKILKTRKKTRPAMACFILRWDVGMCGRPPTPNHHLDSIRLLTKTDHTPLSTFDPFPELRVCVLSCYQCWTVYRVCKQFFCKK